MAALDQRNLLLLEKDLVLMGDVGLPVFREMYLTYDVYFYSRTWTWPHPKPR